MKKLGFTLVFVICITNASGQTINPADTIMARAVNKSRSDAKMMASRYEIKVIKKVENFDPQAPTSEDKKLKKSRKPPITISDMLDEGRYSYGPPESRLLDGTSVFVIRFRPAAEQPDLPSIIIHPEKRVKDEILDGLEGTIYVDGTDYGIRKIEADLIHPVGEWYFRVYAAGPIVFSQRPDGNIWVPDKVEFTATYQAAISSLKRERQIFTFHLHPKNK